MGASGFGLESKNDPKELNVLERSPRSSPIPPREEDPTDDVGGDVITEGEVIFEGDIEFWWEVAFEGEDFGGDTTRGGDITLVGPSADDEVCCLGV